MDEAELKHPNHWFNRAADLHASAGAIWDAMSHEPAAVSARLGFIDGHSMEIACHPVYMMLCGLSLEVVMKAVLACRGDLSDDLLHHDLCKLSLAVGRELTQQERDLLNYYQGALVWSGRYPVPRRSAQAGVYAHRQLGFETFTSPLAGFSLELRVRNDTDSWENYSRLWHSYSSMFKHQ